MVPEFSRNWRNRRHINILRPLRERTSQGVNGYGFDKRRVHHHR
jgi:hypothetical protein